MFASRIFTTLAAATFLLAGSVNGAALIATDPGKLYLCALLRVELRFLHIRC